VRLLLDKGATAQSKNEALEGKTLLQAAAYDGYPAVVEALADRGADVNARDKDGATALWWTAGVGRREAASCLDRKRRGRQCQSQRRDHALRTRAI